MRIVDADIAGVKVLHADKHADRRGFLSETFRASALEAAGMPSSFVLELHTSTVTAGTIRGLHFQVPPRAQAKLIRVVRGAIHDVVVDLRRASPTYGKHVAVELSAQAWNQLFVPVGFAHGFCTLEPSTEVVYRITEYHSPEHERGLVWDDPGLGIRWPAVADRALVSDRDLQFPRLADLPAFFG